MSTRKAGFHGDKRGLAVFSTILASLVAFALFFVSFEGLSYVGHLIGLGGGSWLVPVALDAAIIVATLLAIIRRAQKRRSTLEWAIVYASTAASAAANYASHAQRDQGLLPALVAASAPILLLLLSHAIIRTLIESEQPAPKPKRTAPAAVAVAPAEVAAPTPARAPRPAATRAPRVSAGTVRATDYPFDDVMSRSEEELLQEFDALASSPNTSQKGSAESPRFSTVAWHLVEAHGHRMSDLARRAGHADAARIKDRVRRVREHSPVAA